MLKKYNSYKDSGNGWIGEIPSGWNILALKKISSVTLGKMLASDNKGADLFKPYLRSQNIQINAVNINDVKEMWFSPVELTKYRLREGDLLVNEGGDIGRTCMWRNELPECYIQNSVNRVKILDGNSKYFLYHFYLYHQTGYFESIVNRVSIPHLTKEKLENVKFVVPPIDEQNMIAQYLDAKSFKLDKLISKKEILIDLLSEERFAVINQAVNKGLNPNLPMANSGIDWLGEIPQHWKIKKLKFVAKIVLGKMLTNDDKGGFSLKSYLRAKNIGWFNVNTEDVKTMWFSKSELDQYRVKKNDLLISEGGEVGRTAIWENELDECYIQNSVHKVTVNDDCNPEFFLYLFYLYGKKGHFDAIVNRISIAHLTKEKLSDVRFIVPPKAEQDLLALEIKAEWNRINKLSEKIQNEIQHLKEYKTALISEVVTGKVDIRDEVISELLATA
jgi:type I restriction enzyme S subunit